MISEEQAYQIAKDHIEANGLGVGVRGVSPAAELAGRALFAWRVGDCEGHWVAYVDRGRPRAIRDSLVIAIRRSSGEITYVGSAGDEG